MMDGDDDDLILLSNKHGLQKRERERQRDIRELIGDWGLGGFAHFTHPHI